MAGSYQFGLAKKSDIATYSAGFTIANLMPKFKYQMSKQC